MAPPIIESFDYNKFGASPSIDTDLTGNVRSLVDMPRCIMGIALGHSRVMVLLSAVA